MCNQSDNADWDGKCVLCRTSSEQVIHGKTMLAISKLPAKHIYSLNKRAMQELYDATRKEVESVK